MTPTHADKLAGALEDIRQTSRAYAQSGDRKYYATDMTEIALKADTVLTAYRARPQLPEAELAIWEELTRLYTQGYHAGHEDTVEARYTDVPYHESRTYFKDQVSDIISDPTNEDAEMIRNAILSAIEGRAL